MERQSDMQIERAFQRYCQLLELWSRENTIKTQKLQYFLLTTALLIAAFALTPDTSGGKPLMCLAGAALSLIWTLSLGRTMRFQKKWQFLLEELSSAYSGDSRFQILKSVPATTTLPALLRIIGCVSSRYYLIGAPLAGIVFWIWLFSTV